MKRISRAAGLVLVITIAVMGLSFGFAQPRANAVDLDACARTIWDTLLSWGFTEIQAAGIMGNFKAESDYCPTNAEYKKGLYADIDDSDVYPGTMTEYEFVYDGYGYGIAQWTFYSRKQGLWDMARRRGTGVGNLQTQLAFLKEELKGYLGTNWFVRLGAMNTIAEVSDYFMVNFECPANQSDEAKANRRAFGELAYRRFCGSAVVIPEMGEPDFFLPEFLKTIDESAFAGASMTAVQCPEELRAIGARAFRDCARLKEIYIPAAVTSMGKDVFAGCPSDLTIFGHKNSAAEAYAAKYQIRFVAVESSHQ